MAQAEMQPLIPCSVMNGLAALRDIFAAPVLAHAFPIGERSAPGTAEGEAA